MNWTCDPINRASVPDGFFWSYEMFTVLLKYQMFALIDNGAIEYFYKNERSVQCLFIEFCAIYSGRLILK